MSNNPFEYNGGCVVAMKGKNSVAIACDTRLGANFSTVSMSFVKVFKIQDNILLGIAGLGSDIQTFAAKMKYKLELYRLREGKDMKPSTFVKLVGNSLFEHRFGSYFINPIVVGLEDGKPIISTFDSIGCSSTCEPFGVSGIASNELLGMCEAYYEEDLEPEKLEDILGSCLLYGFDRNIKCGWGAITYLLTEKGIEIKCLKTKLV